MAIFNTVPPLQAGAGIKFDGLTISTAAAPRNLLDNSDFTNLVAQAGIGGKHGTVAYAADRWILDSGTVSYAAGVGMTLDGTIKQKLERIPAAAYPYIGMASGTASISYGNGTVTIVSRRGVIKWASLYTTEYSSAAVPEYQPKGYGTELIECQLYYKRIVNGSFMIAPNVQGSAYFSNSVYVGDMRVSPSVTAVENNNGKIGVVQNISFVSKDDAEITMDTDANAISVRTTNSNYAGRQMQIFLIELSADFV